MSANPTIVIRQPRDRAQVARWASSAKVGTAVSFSLPDKRTLEQNNMIHELCTKVAKQIVWQGKKRNVEAWKDIFTAALRSARHELDVVPGINGGFVLLGMHTSSMTVPEASELIELILAWGTENGVEFHDGEGSGAAVVAAPVAANG